MHLTYGFHLLQKPGPAGEQAARRLEEFTLLMTYPRVVGERLWSDPHGLEPDICMYTGYSLCTGAQLPSIYIISYLVARAEGG